MNLTPWAWLIVPLGLARAMQIVLWDRITQGPRGWLLARLNPQGLSMKNPDRPYLSYLLECPWCMSVWIGAAAVGLLAWDATRAATLLVLAALALSLLMVLIDRIIDRTLPDEAPEPETPVQLHGDLVVATPDPWPAEPPADVAAALDAFAPEDEG